MKPKAKRKCNARCNRFCPKWVKCLKELGLPADFSVEDRDTRFKPLNKSINTTVDKSKKAIYTDNIILHT
jgi:hypothetical protein